MSSRTHVSIVKPHKTYHEAKRKTASSTDWQI